MTFIGLLIGLVIGFQAGWYICKKAYVEDTVALISATHAMQEAAKIFNHLRNGKTSEKAKAFSELYGPGESDDTVEPDDFEAKKKERGIHDGQSYWD
jgi:hypothetical protein